MSKKLKVISMIAVMMAAFTAPFFTTKAHVNATDTYWLILSNTSWTEYTGQDYTCTGAPGPCLMRFPEGVTPDDGLEHGIPEGEEEGFAVLNP